MLKHSSQALHIRRLCLLVAVVCLVPLEVGLPGCQDRTAKGPAAESPGTYLFCFWNVENFFDDRDDGRTGPGDKQYDPWFANNPKILELKLAHLSEVILSLNDGKGPDILAVAEVESPRAAELLQQALNQRLGDKAPPYDHVLMKEPNGSRHIAPAILTRLPVHASKTKIHGRERILEGHVEVDGHDLIVIASHWTSRLSDKEGHQRGKYGDQIYGHFKAAFKSNPQVDLLVCGDFNDPPDAPSVTQHLHAIGDITAVLESREEPLLLDLFADKDPEQFGTHYYHKWFIFDQIAVSPGMLDKEGWSCDPASAATVKSPRRAGDKHHQPWGFGNEHFKGQRGYSDHFPVTVQLHVAGK